MDDDLFSSRPEDPLASLARQDLDPLSQHELDERIVAPTRRAMILHRLGEAARERALEPGLARWAGRLRRAFVDRWGEVPLDHAPAFRPTAHG